MKTAAMKKAPDSLRDDGRARRTPDHPVGLLHPLGLRAMTKKRIDRVAIVCDEAGYWFVRRLAWSEHDRVADEMIYHCDRPIGTRFDTLDEACDAAMAVQEPRRPPTSFVGAFGGKADVS